jgi:hypothetical protein
MARPERLELPSLWFEAMLGKINPLEKRHLDCAKWDTWDTRLTVRVFDEELFSGKGEFPKVETHRQERMRQQLNHGQITERDGEVLPAPEA